MRTVHTNPLQALGPHSHWLWVLSCKFGYLWSSDCLWSCKITEHWNLFWFFWCSSFLQVWRSHFIFCVRKKTTFQIFSSFSDTSFDGEKAWLEKQSQPIDVVNTCFNIFYFTILQILISLVCYPRRPSLRQGCTAELSIFKENQHCCTCARTVWRTHFWGTERKKTSTLSESNPRPPHYPCAVTLGLSSYY